MGCELNCSTMTDHTQDYKFVIGRPELVQFFTTESPAQCFGFEGTVVHVRTCVYMYMYCTCVYTCTYTVYIYTCTTYMYTCS